MDDKLDKHWAKRYILDPLTDPEPNQVTGPGSSHYNHRRALLQAQPSSQSHPHLAWSSSSSSSLEISSMTHASHHGRPENGDGDDIYPTPPHSAGSSSGPGHYRNLSLNERFPGDLSHRPLDMIRHDIRAAERPLRHRRHISDTDMIDALDTIGGTYHHGGPYDATLLSRNLDEKYSPVAAVQKSNMEALRATPREYILDSIRHHMPLQGTATIPSGALDPSGCRMLYEEGPDLMREPDAPGGPFRRWEHIDYHPDDLEGRGEPSYTFEKESKKKKRAKKGEPEVIEMVSGLRSRRSRFKLSKRRRSASAAFVENSSSSTGNAYNNAGLQRRSSAGKRLSEGFKRRWGTIRGRTRTMISGTL